MFKHGSYEKYYICTWPGKDLTSKVNNKIYSNPTFVYHIITLYINFSQFYVYPATGVRVFSKEDVLLYVKEMKITECDTDGQCDINSQDNVYFLPSLFPLHN
jgi:hypothetical protein